MGMTVVRAGLLTTVQDLGRTGFQQYGVPAGGAMDPFALQVANLLVGNAPQAAGLEMTIQGATLAFEREAVVAVCGAAMPLWVNDRPVPLWTSVALEPGDVLRCGRATRGSRAYLAVAGGIDVPAVLGSRATYLRGRLGGLEGRALRAGDRLAFHPPSLPLELLKGRSLPWRYRPEYAERVTVRFLPGPQASAFTDEAWRRFETEEYTVTPDSDRMGYRLRGPVLQHREGADILSEAIPRGAVQVPGDGQPIVMMADRQPTGGYPKIAVVIAADLPLMAQLKPGEQVRFQRTTLAEAHRLWRRQAAVLHSLQQLNRLLA